MLQSKNSQTFNAQDFSTRYQIIETDSGPLISESRVYVYDVMELWDEGLSIYEIAPTFNLSPLQVQTAVDYIERNRVALTPRFERAIQLREERHRYYQAIQAELREKIAQEPMTPRRAAFYALREKNRLLDEAEKNAAHTQRS